MKNIFYIIRYLSDENSANWLQISFYCDKPHNYIVVVSDEEDNIIHTIDMTDELWHNFILNVFSYNIKLLELSDDSFKIINEQKFDIKNHNFNIILKSENNDEIKIWKYYLWLIQLKLDVKFTIIVNEDFPTQDGCCCDFFEISRKAYDIYLENNSKSTDDYSSINIITTLFDVIKDKSEILNHPWLKN